MKETIKKKLKDVTLDEYIEWKEKNCIPRPVICEDCIFRKTKHCGTGQMCWVNNKGMYSDKFLNQEIEVEVEVAKLTDDEKVILKNLDKKWKYIARDRNKVIYVYRTQPFKGLTSWMVYTCDYARLPYSNLFKFIKWKDEGPHLIEDLLRKEE